VLDGRARPSGSIVSRAISSCGSAEGWEQDDAAHQASPRQPRKDHGLTSRYG
jgi:hypothetical protein